VTWRPRRQLDHTISAWSLKFRKKKLKKIRDALPEELVTFKDRVKSILKDKHNRDVTDWRQVDEICLAAGYLLLLGSAVLRLFVPVAA
jgi:hypothetical protein